MYTDKIKKQENKYLHFFFVEEITTSEDEITKCISTWCAIGCFQISQSRSTIHFPLFWLAAPVKGGEKKLPKLLASVVVLKCVF